MDPLAKLRQVVRDCISKHSYSSAVFFADKLVSMSGLDEDIYNLAECYYFTKQYKRARFILTKYKLLTRDFKSIYLAAECSAACNEWEECLEILSAEEKMPTTSDRKVSDQRGQIIDISSAIYLLRGKACTALENRTRATYWFKEALKRDIFCYEAFEHLVDYNMLTTAEANQLLNTLHFEEDSMWLQQLYASKLKKYEATDTTSLDELETKFHLKNNADVAITKAELYFYQHNFQKCFDITKRLLAEDPFNQGTAMITHLSCLVELKLKNELFYCGHKLVEENSASPVAWYGVACYYYLIGNLDNSRRYFSKSTTLNSHFGPGWLGFGHSFAAQGEHDQAMSAYRTASRLLSGCHLAALCIGMELIRVNNFPLAQQHILQAKEMCPNDPLVYNELGVIQYKTKNYRDAIALFQQTIRLCGKNLNETWEATLVNIAHCYRKLREYGGALRYYHQALSVSPTSAGTMAAIAYTHQLQGNLLEAIDSYHKCLGLKPEDSFATDMLAQCLALVRYS